MKNKADERELSLVFGEDSYGETPEERAKTSSRCFIRGQLQLAGYSDQASGRVLRATEALKIFGWSSLLKVALDGAKPLISSPQEPAATLKRRREELGLSHEDLKRKTKIPSKVIRAAETPGTRTPIRTLESLAQTLGLDEQVLGMIPDAHRDANLGVRLREMASDKAKTPFSAHTVLQFAEAAWVIDRQVSLQRDLSESGLAFEMLIPRPFPDYSYPVYKIGYDLARKTRRILDISDDSPIESVRKVIEDRFNIPLIQEKMSPKLAGATLANGSTRGIIVNEAGANSNVWVRRMTLCHELGHLLWDPDDRLKKVTVDTYADLERSDRDHGRDHAETRANAFAVAFLAPPAAVESIANRCNNPTDVVKEVMSKFGISATAAKHHIHNITNLDTLGISNRDLPTPETDWDALENLMIDYFPDKNVSSSRRGKFAWCVAKAYQLNQISLDSAISYFSSDADCLTEDSLRQILKLSEGA
ncbi:XRE family transcriptional regulator [Xanthomonas sacchari]|uniref:XRE family transcriptional regulator n=1 Tax=Xanthomonas sacchari TaxID=56458 RepID=UPI00225061BD|nr:XRE family transcriptional regulator [Xanthomonas sacchari]MCW0410909.1 hypothetical protein [Xanthomonas sacchari]UYK65070.1 XRE family transcriptional regulator [Xanthomonas sacchari]